MGFVGTRILARWFGRSVALLVVAGAGLAMVPIGAGSAGAVTSFQAHAFNMAMGNEGRSNAHPLGQAHSLHDETLGEVINISIQQRPWMVSTEEICLDQYQTIQSQMGGYGYQAMFVQLLWALPIWSQCLGRYGKGNAVFAAGPYVGHYSSPSLPPEEPPSMPNRQLRAAVCLRTQNIGFQMDSCAVHLSSDAWTAAEQSHNLFNWSQLYSGWWNVTGGDFNHDYYQSTGYPTGIGEYWFRGAEMSLPSVTATTANNAHQFDYIFAFRTHATIVGRNIMDLGYSDHKYCIGVFNYS